MMFVRCCGGSSLKQTSSIHTHPGLGRLMMCSPSQPQALLGLHTVGSRGQLAPPGPSWSWMCSSLILSPIGTHSYATYSIDCMAAAMTSCSTAITPKLKAKKYILMKMTCVCSVLLLCLKPVPDQPETKVMAAGCRHKLPPVLSGLQPSRCLCSQSLSHGAADGGEEPAKSRRLSDNSLEQ